LTEQVRGRLYELISHCIPPDVIFVGLLKELIKNCDGNLKTEVRKKTFFSQLTEMLMGSQKIESISGTHLFLLYKDKLGIIS